MTFLTTGYPLLDLGIACVIGYTFSWLFVTRSLRSQLNHADSRMYQAETETRTYQRELTKVRDEVKTLQSKLSNHEEALTAARNLTAKTQSDLKAATEENIGLNVELEKHDSLVTKLQTQLAAAQEQAARDKEIAIHQLADLEQKLQLVADSTLNTHSEQTQVEKRLLEAKIAAIQAEGVPIKANLTNLAAENESLKWRISAIQAENQLLRTQSNSVLSELETLLWRVSPMLRRSQDVSAAGEQWLRGNLNIERHWPGLPHLMERNGDLGVNAAISE